MPRCLSACATLLQLRASIYASGSRFMSAMSASTISLTSSCVQGGLGGWEEMGLFSVAALRRARYNFAVLSASKGRGAPGS